MANVSFDPAGLSPAQLDGLACVVCGDSALTGEVASVPVGIVDGGQVFACRACVDEEPGRDDDVTRALLLAEKNPAIGSRLLGILLAHADEDGLDERTRAELMRIKAELDETLARLETMEQKMTELEAKIPPAGE